MTFKDQPWETRFKKMGDEAEGIFESVAARNKWGYHRSGLNRPEEFNMLDIPVMVRYTPDYLCDWAYVEVQGFGADRLFKLKREKWGALCEWNDKVFHTELFAWDSITQRYCLFSLDWLDYRQYDTEGVYPEGKQWVGWNVDSLPGWLPYVSQ